MAVAVTAVTAVTALCGCRRGKAKDAAPDAAIAASAAPSTVPVASFLARILDAGKPPNDGGDEPPPPVLDAGPLACRLVQGPIEQLLTGPAALAASDTGVDVVVHKNGAAKVTRVVAEPVATAKPVRRDLAGATPDKASKPACALAGAFAFCSDVKGDVHKLLRAAPDQPPDEVVAHAEPGARVVATEMAGHHVAIGWLAVRRTTEGRVSEAYVRIDDADPVRISEEGSGATDLALAARGGSEAVAVLVDARRAMSPVHARAISLAGGHLTVGPDVVVYVGGGADHQVLTALGTTEAHAAFAMMPDSAEEGFGLTTLPLAEPLHMDGPHHLSRYPNGLDSAPVAATRGARAVYVARVRPIDAAVGSTRVLELGKLDTAGEFSSFGVVPTSGSVATVAVEADPKVAGGLWLHYTDAAGSWIERRVCP